MILNPPAPAINPPGISLMAGEIELPLEAVNVTAHVDGAGVVWTVVQVFTNTMTEAAEAVYTFPLPNDGAVSAMMMTIGDREVVAEIKKREEARAEYEEAVAQGFTAGLLEQEAGEIFTMAVGNIHPGESIAVTITVHDSVDRDGTDATVRMPTLVKERYVPADTPNAEASTPPRHTGNVHVSSTVAVTFALPVVDLVCDTVEGASIRDQSLTIDGFALDRDIVVRWQVPAEILEAKWTPDANDPEMGTIEVDVRIDRQARKTKRKAVAITIDRSGSMNGYEIDLAKRVASDVVAGLNSNDVVHVAAFDDQVEPLSACWSGPVPATESHKSKILREIDSIYTCGGTEFDGAIEAVGTAVSLVDDRADGAEFEKVVVIITDGAYGDEATAARQRAVHLRDARVIVVGIGHDLNGYLRTLTADGHFISVSSGDRAPAVSRKLCDRISTPAERHARLEMEGLVDQAPHNAPDIYPGAPIRLWGRVARPTEGAQVTVVTDSGVLVSIPVRIADDQSATSRWAKARINAVDFDVAAGAIDFAAGEEAIVAMSLSFGVLSKYTAWLAIDRSRTTDSIVPQRVHQPVLGLAVDMHRFQMPLVLSDHPVTASSGVTFRSALRMNLSPSTRDHWSFASPRQNRVPTTPSQIEELLRILGRLASTIGSEGGLLDESRVLAIINELSEWMGLNGELLGRRSAGKVTRRIEKVLANDWKTHKTLFRIVQEIIIECGPHVLPTNDVF